MDDIMGLIPVSPGRAKLVEALSGLNSLTSRYGLSLSRQEMEALADRQSLALRETERVEFGHGPAEKLIRALCDSPYVTGADYAKLIGDLCELFYQFKRESAEAFSDDELVEVMAGLFNGEGQGSLELVADRVWQMIHEEPGEEREEDEAFDE
ncbi:MAG: DUF6323 family protein [Oscillospiraceae bacterium]|jgi:hypothetical protein|nr:DUF6323 family protein [Oscillospiraceae bacterium]